MNIQKAIKNRDHKIIVRKKYTLSAEGIKTAKKKESNFHSPAAVDANWRVSCVFELRQKDEIHK
jgi:hypothetical protein